MTVDECLATYGTLAPGRPNHHHLSDLKGQWLTGKVRGNLVQRGWGAELGYPALIPADDGGEIEVYLFISPTCRSTGCGSMRLKERNTVVHRYPFKPTIVQ